MGQQHSSRQNLQDAECSGCSGGRSPASADASSSGESPEDCGPCPHCSDRSSEEHEERPSSEASGSLDERQCCRSAKVDSLKQDLSAMAITQRCCCSTGDLCKKTSSVDRYVSALVSRGCWRGAPSSGSSADRRRRRRGGWTARFGTSESPQRALARDASGRRCVCTAYRRVEEDDLANGSGTVCRWTAAAVLAVGESPHSHSADDTDVILLSLPSSSGAPLLDLSRLEQRLSGAEAGEAPASSAASEHVRQHETNERSLNYKRAHFQVVCGADLRALILSAAAPMPPPIPPPPTSEPLPSMTPMVSMMPPPPYAVPLPTKIHTQVDYIHCLVPDLRAIIACAFYWGKMDRYEAERLLDGRPEGTFLLRDSAQEDHLFSVSFRKYGRSLHARIEHFNHRFSFDSHDPGVYSARTVTGLIEHYKDPACVMFFEPMLTWPLARVNPFSLQQLARATIASSTTYDGISELPLPTSLQAYLKEYHYRQRVRVTRFDNPN